MSSPPMLKAALAYLLSFSSSFLLSPFSVSFSTSSVTPTPLPFPPAFYSSSFVFALFSFYNHLLFFFTSPPLSVLSYFSPFLLESLESDFQFAHFRSDYFKSCITNAAHSCGRPDEPINSCRAFSGGSSSVSTCRSTSSKWRRHEYDICPQPPTPS